MKDLIERLTAADGPSALFDADIYCAVNPNCERDRNAVIVRNETGHKVSKIAPPAYTSSLDAALGLVPEGWFWEVAHGIIVRGGRGPYWATVYNYETLGDMVDTDPDVPGAGPAIALCIAALRARQATQGKP